MHVLVQMDLSHALTITAMAHTHYRHGGKKGQACNGTISTKEIDPITEKEVKITLPCQSCIHHTERLGTIPIQFLSECLSEPPSPPARFSMATLLLESVLERGTHKSRRGQRDFIAGMKLLKDYQDLGGKLNVSH
jgi:hypothetical protein